MLLHAATITFTTFTVIIYCTHRGLCSAASSIAASSAKSFVALLWGLCRRCRSRLRMMMIVGTKG